MQSANAYCESNLAGIKILKEKRKKSIKQGYHTSDLNIGKIIIFSGFLIKCVDSKWTANDFAGRTYNGYRYRNCIVLQDIADKYNIAVFSWDGKPKDFFRKEDVIIIDKGGIESFFQI